MLTVQQRTPKFAGFCPGLGITLETSPALEKQFFYLLELLSIHLEKNDFLLGPHPTAADFAFYGDFYAHLSRDPVPGYIVKTQAPLVAAWIDRISYVRQSKDAAPKQTVNDEIPSTLLPILQLLMTDYIPLVSKTVKAVTSFLAENPTKPIPRGLGSTDFTLHCQGRLLVKGQRKINTHCVWMLQRIMDKVYFGDGILACDEVLEAIDGKDSQLVQHWRSAVAELRQSDWKISRNKKSQLVGQRVALQSNL
jgi:hypothetical protein